MVVQDEKTKNSKDTQILPGPNYTGPNYTYSVHCRMFDNILGLYLADIVSTPPPSYYNKKCLQTLQNVP